MRRVRCVSPHGGAHHGLRADNGGPAPEGYTGALQLDPNPGGWVYNTVLGHVAVGSEVDAPDDFTCDGFHFEDAGDPLPHMPPSAAAVSSLADLLKGA